MSPEEHRELFMDSLGEWLEENGVVITRTDCYPFDATADLNALKYGMICLIRAFGGDI